MLFCFCANAAAQAFGKNILTQSPDIVTKRKTRKREKTMQNGTKKDCLCINNVKRWLNIVKMTIIVLFLFIFSVILHPNEFATKLKV